jgi:CrcB protein
VITAAASFLVLAGGAVGAPLRYVIDGYVKARSTSLPWGTFTVNVLGSALLGALHGASVGSHLEALLGTGLCGALTTFSTFELDSVHLLQDGAYGKAALYTAGSLLVGFAAFFALHDLVHHLT